MGRVDVPTYPCMYFLVVCLRQHDFRLFLGLGPGHREWFLKKEQQDVLQITVHDHNDTCWSCFQERRNCGFEILSTGMQDR
jgi:hypothetical protein